MAHYAIVVDLDRCIGCHGCEIACKNENNIALGEYWNKVVERGPFGEYPDLEMYFLPTMCQQCQDAPCVNVCPTGASYRDADGMVLVDKEKCKNGELPMCVRTCSAGARFYGDIDDPSSDASKALAAADPASIHTLQDVGNHPATHYILSPKRAAWKEGE